ncbi:MAG: hypothetical protein MJ078_03485, partial [Clostridia bacterium]|nr:hypothetical protein [Clostridia bacterium]
MKVKQRLLSVLLVLCMLVSMLPMVIFTASSKPVAPETIESYYDLYVTGGLKAMFDAFDTANLKLTDLGEGVTDGLWYALVPDEAGKLVKNEALTATVYQADAWTLGDSGFGYSATLAQTRNKSKGEMPGVEFPLSLLTGGDYTVESVLAVTGVKNNSTGEPIKEGGDCYNPISYAVAYGPFAGMTWGIGYRWCYTDTANWNGHNTSSGMRHWLSTNYNSLRQENTAESFAGSVFNQTVTYDYSAATASAAESATYTLSYNGTLQGSFTSGDSKLAETNRDFFPVDGEKNYFVLLNGMPGSLYNVRIYDHVLTNEEINRNHFADLALLTGLDVSAFNKLSAEDQADLFYATATVGFDIDAAALLKIAETISVAKMKKAFTDYDKLYVGADGTATADGAKLLGLFTAFGKNDVSVDFESAVWYNKVGAQNATMCGAAYVPADDSTGTPASGYWRYYEDGGMGYDLAASDDGVYLRRPIGLLPKTNYTIEVTSAVRGLTKNGAGEEMLDIVDVQYGRMASASKAFFCFGYFNAWLYTGNGSGSTPAIYVGNNLLTMYAEGNAIGWQAAGTATIWAHGSTSMNLYNGYFNKIVAADIVSTVSGGKTTYTAYRDGAKSYSRVFDTINGTGAQSFNMFLSGGNTTYAVRVYSGVLTEGERNLNRFVDLLAYAEVDPTDFLALDSAVRAQIAAQFTTAEFTKDKTTLQEDIDSYIQEIKNAEKKRTMTKYDELYIGADGSTTANGGKLVGLFSEYGKNDVSVSIRTGTWYNKIAHADGTYTNAPIVGGVYDEKTTPTGGQFGE